MKKKILVIHLLCLFLCVNANAAIISFHGEILNGIGSATVHIFPTTGNTINIQIDNTSPTQLKDNSGPNTPAIVGFGFDLTGQSEISFINWSLSAYTQNDLTTPLIIGGTSPLSLDKWEMTNQLANVNLDFIPQVAKALDGALYNPDVISQSSTNLPGGKNIPFFTSAQFTMEFDSLPVIDQSSFFIRMQNVGENGEGSLKLTKNAPEPATMFLFTFAIILGLFFHKKPL